MVGEAKSLPSRSYDSPVFTVQSTIKLSAIIKFNYKTCYSSALCVNSNTLITCRNVWVVLVTFLLKISKFSISVLLATSRSIQVGTASE